jgi:beta-glucosidase
VIATVKHFVANNQEILRSSINVIATQRTLAEIYQPAFRSAVTRGGVGAVMCSYNRIGGTYACENGDELTGVLREAWNFDGFVMSDWGALHSTAAAANAGLDMEMPGASSETNPTPIDQLFGSHFNSKLTAAVQSGAVSEATLDTMVRNILTAMFRVGLFDHPLPTPASVKDTNVSSPEHLRLATTIGAAGTVLLKNADGTLPLDAESLHSIAVIGDAAQEHPQTTAGGKEQYRHRGCHDGEADNPPNARAAHTPDLFSPFPYIWLDATSPRAWTNPVATKGRQTAARSRPRLAPQKAIPIPTAATPPAIQRCGKAARPHTWSSDVL